jgi:Protein of unknown function (DUF2950)
VALQAAAVVALGAANDGSSTSQISLNNAVVKLIDEVLEDGMSLKHLRVVFATRLLPLALIIPLTACNTNKQPDKPLIKTFASPDDAGDAAIAAAKSGDRSTILAIFGPGSEDVLYSGDLVDDKNIRDEVWHDASLAHDAGWQRSPDRRSR